MMKKATPPPVMEIVANYNLYRLKTWYGTLYTVREIENFDASDYMVHVEVKAYKATCSCGKTMNGKLCPHIKFVSGQRPYPRVEVEGTLLSMELETIA